jgi:hypothetical protein
MFDVCTAGDTVHIDTLLKFLNTSANMGASIFFSAAMIRAFRSARSRGNGETNFDMSQKKTRVLLFSYNKFLESRSTLWNALYNNIQSGAKIALKYTQHVHYRR